MMEESRYRDAESKSPPRTPRWVKVVGIIAIVVVVLVGVLLLAGGGNHGPGRHTGSDAETPSSITEAGGGNHAPPAGAHASP